MSDATPTNPDAPKSDEPKGFLEKIGAALPIGLTALATVFAGMSTGALQQAMYWKSQAAQDQSKATNQWTLAGFKVDRALVMQTAAVQLSVSASGRAPEFTPDSSPDQKAAVEWLEGKGPPEVYRRGADAKRREGRVGLPDVSAPLQELLDMIRKRAPEEDVARKAARIPKAEINKAINDAEAENEKITEGDWTPKVDAARKLVADSRKKDADPAKSAAAQASLFELERRRYRSEATLNQEVAALYEARVRTSSAESDKHRSKSEILFIAMLVAQIGGVVSSLALARKNKSALWLFASMVGLAALGVGLYGVLSTLLPN
ncbi:hypothetical protein [Frigoriglobus tundricola]|uniref:Transmembrane protein n=1 Tax=Frigoriglobus tundricola TaxID=2774151 RepID=A0A6M5YY12_9BACT|nr:hypothetical protein [Frigoriglobus tundricola]QJW98131.1 hypothetical protein FTUN_5711 [Frigoriglobus tundricola]